MVYIEQKIFLRPGEKFEIKNLFGAFGWWVIGGKGKISDVDFGEEYKIFPENFPDDIDCVPSDRIEIKGRNLIFYADNSGVENLVFSFFLCKY